MLPVRTFIWIGLVCFLPFSKCFEINNVQIIPKGTETLYKNGEKHEITRYVLVPKNVGTNNGITTNKHKVTHKITFNHDINSQHDLNAVKNLLYKDANGNINEDLHNKDQDLTLTRAKADETKTHNFVAKKTISNISNNVHHVQQHVVSAKINPDSKITTHYSYNVNKTKLLKPDANKANLNAGILMNHLQDNNEYNYSGDDYEMYIKDPKNYKVSEHDAENILNLHNINLDKLTAEGIDKLKSNLVQAKGSNVDPNKVYTRVVMSQTVHKVPKVVGHTIVTQNVYGEDGVPQYHDLTHEFVHNQDNIPEAVMDKAQLKLGLHSTRQQKSCYRFMLSNLLEKYRNPLENLTKNGMSVSQIKKLLKKGCSLNADNMKHFWFLFFKLLNDFNGDVNSAKKLISVLTIFTHYKLDSMPVTKLDVIFDILSKDANDSGEIIEVLDNSGDDIVLNLNDNEHENTSNGVNSILVTDNLNPNPQSGYASILAQSSNQHRPKMFLDSSNKKLASHNLNDKVKELNLYLQPSNEAHNNLYPETIKENSDIDSPKLTTVLNGIVTLSNNHKINFDNTQDIPLTTFMNSYTTEKYVPEFSLDTTESYVDESNNNNYPQDYEIESGGFVDKTRMEKEPGQPVNLIPALISEINIKDNILPKQSPISFKYEGPLHNFPIITKNVPIKLNPTNDYNEDDIIPSKNKIDHILKTNQMPDDKFSIEFPFSNDLDSSSSESDSGESSSESSGSSETSIMFSDIASTEPNIKNDKNPYSLPSSNGYTYVPVSHHSKNPGHVIIPVHDAHDTESLEYPHGVITNQKPNPEKMVLDDSQLNVIPILTNQKTNPYAHSIGGQTISLGSPDINLHELEPPPITYFNNDYDPQAYSFENNINQKINDIDDQLANLDSYNLKETQAAKKQVLSLLQKLDLLRTVQNVLTDPSLNETINNLFGQTKVTGLTEVTGGKDANNMNLNNYYDNPVESTETINNRYKQELNNGTENNVEVENVTLLQHDSDTNKDSVQPLIQNDETKITFPDSSPVTIINEVIHEKHLPDNLDTSKEPPLDNQKNLPNILPLNIKNKIIYQNPTPIAHDTNKELVQPLTPVDENKTLLPNIIPLNIKNEIKPLPKYNNINKDLVQPLTPVDKQKNIPNSFPIDSKHEILHGNVPPYQGYFGRPSNSQFKPQPFNGYGQNTNIPVPQSFRPNMKPRPVFPNNIHSHPKLYPQKPQCTYCSNVDYHHQHYHHQHLGLPYDPQQLHQHYTSHHHYYNGIRTNDRKPINVKSNPDVDIPYDLLYILQDNQGNSPNRIFHDYYGTVDPETVTTPNKYFYIPTDKTQEFHPRHLEILNFKSPRTAVPMQLKNNYDKVPDNSNVLQEIEPNNNALNLNSETPKENYNPYSYDTVTVNKPESSVYSIPNSDFNSILDINSVKLPDQDNSYPLNSGEVNELNPSLLNIVTNSYVNVPIKIKNLDDNGNPHSDTFEVVNETKPFGSQIIPNGTHYAHFQSFDVGIVNHPLYNNLLNVDNVTPLDNNLNNLSYQPNDENVQAPDSLNRFYENNVLDVEEQPKSFAYNNFANFDVNQNDNEQIQVYPQNIDIEQVKHLIYNNAPNTNINIPLDVNLDDAPQSYTPTLTNHPELYLKLSNDVNESYEYEDQNEIPDQNETPYHQSWKPKTLNSHQLIYNSISSNDEFKPLQLKNLDNIPNQSPESYPYLNENSLTSINSINFNDAYKIPENNYQSYPIKADISISNPQKPSQSYVPLHIIHFDNNLDTNQAYLNSYSLNTETSPLLDDSYSLYNSLSAQKNIPYNIPKHTLNNKHSFSINMPLNNAKNIDNFGSITNNEPQKLSLDTEPNYDLYSPGKFVDLTKMGNNPDSYSNEINTLNTVPENNVHGNNFDQDSEQLQNRFNDYDADDKYKSPESSLRESNENMDDSNALYLTEAKKDITDETGRIDNNLQIPGVSFLQKQLSNLLQKSNLKKPHNTDLLNLFLKIVNYDDLTLEDIKTIIIKFLDTINKLIKLKPERVVNELVVELKAYLQTQIDYKQYCDKELLLKINKEIDDIAKRIFDK